MSAETKKPAVTEKTTVKDSPEEPKDTPAKPVAKAPEKKAPELRPTEPEKTEKIKKAPGTSG